MKQVADIRQRFSAGEKRTLLAREYGVSWCCIRDIITGRTWRIYVL